MRNIIVLAHNIRSTHNVGSLLRTCDGINVKKLYFTGYTPYPATKNDARLPHISAKLTTQIQKTALGAQNLQNWQYKKDTVSIITELKRLGYKICALEQTDNATSLTKFVAPQKVALIIGNEVDGLEDEILNLTDTQLEIPMLGKKESYNVVQATAMALFYLRFIKP